MLGDEAASVSGSAIDDDVELCGGVHDRGSFFGGDLTNLHRQRNACR
jgi:hypothetical protein